MVYLLCARDPRTGEHYKQGGRAGHYIGWTKDERACPETNSRIVKHYAGKGAALPRVWVKGWTDKDGVFHATEKTFIVSRWWRGGTRALERQLKNRKNARKLCPFCQSELKDVSHLDDLL